MGGAFLSLAEFGCAAGNGGQRLSIFRAFPSFGAKIPQKDLLHWPKAFALGGWLGGGLQWHLTFMWIYIAHRALLPGLSDVQRKLSPGAVHCRAIVRGVWPMVHYYFFFGPKPVGARGL